VPQETLEKILEAGRWAMSGANAQPWEFVVVRDPAVRAQVAGSWLTPNQEAWAIEQTRVPEIRHHHLRAPLSAIRSTLELVTEGYVSDKDKILEVVRKAFAREPLIVGPGVRTGMPILYDNPREVGADRIVNAVAAYEQAHTALIVVDFGTAVTFDVVNRAGNYAGGIIAPGLAAMTDYLHEKTALLPKIKIREVKTTIGKSTEQAMLIGAVHGYRGLVRELIAELKRELRVKHLPVVATGGYAKLIAAKLPEISAVAPDLTLEGLRLIWLAN